MEICSSFPYRTDCSGADDTSCSFPRLKGPEEQQQVMQQLITPQRHEGNHSAVSHMNRLRAQTLLMNPKRFYWLSLFSWISFNSCCFLLTGSINDRGVRKVSQSLKFFIFVHLDAQMHSSSHLYACDADDCLIWYLRENSSDQWSRW